MTVAQRVLSLPELRAQVLAWIAADHGGPWTDPVLSSKMLEDDPTLSPSDAGYQYYSDGVLIRCAQVNSQWWHQAIPHLWEKLDLMWPTPEQVFEKIAPERRQRYANYVRETTMYLLEEKHSIPVARSCLADVVFPKLESMKLLVPGNAFGYHSLHDIEIPVFHAPHLVSLTIDPAFEWLPVSYRVCQKEWAVLLGLIAVSFVPRPPTVADFDRLVFQASNPSSSTTTRESGRASSSVSRIGFLI